MSLDNKQLYKRTLGFSFRRLFWDIISLLIFITVAAYFAGLDKKSSKFKKLHAEL